MTKPCRFCRESFVLPYNNAIFCCIDCRFWSKVDKRGPDECWFWIGTRVPKGYGMMKDGKGGRPAHVISWEIHNGPVPDGLWVLHSCDDRYPAGDPTYRACVNPRHLWTGTHQDNMADMVAKGRSPQSRGEASFRAKIDDSIVIQIREATGTISEIAKRFNLGTSQTCRIRRRQAWAHVGAMRTEGPLTVRRA